MFQNCTSLTTAPELPAITLTNACYAYMFNGCSSLNYIKCLATNVEGNGDWLIQGRATQEWVTNVASSGTFVCKKYAPWAEGDNGCPNLWITEFID